MTGELTIIQTALTLVDDIINLCAQAEVAKAQQQAEILKREVQGFDALVKVYKGMVDDKQATLDKLMRTIRDQQKEINELKGVD